MTDVPDAVYVYAVVPGPLREPISAAGVEGSEVLAVESEGLVALVSPVSGAELRAGRDLRAHWRVLQEAFERTTVLPIRFGTAMESEEAIREQLLEPNSQYLAERLRELHGLAQLQVVGRYDEDLLLREIVRDAPEVSTLRARINRLPGAAAHTQRVRLGELVAAEVMRRREHDTAYALSALEPLAVATRSEPSLETGAAFDLTFLVAQAERDAFDETVGGLKETFEGRIEIRYVGPLPPYSFAEADLSTEVATWA